MHISQAELQDFVGEDAAGVSKAKKGMICEHNLHVIIPASTLLISEGK